MGIDPERIPYLRLASDLGHVQQNRIEQLGEPIGTVRTNFELIESFRHVRMA